MLEREGNEFRFLTYQITFMLDIWLEMFWCSVASSGVAGRSLG